MGHPSFLLIDTRPNAGFPHLLTPLRSGRSHCVYTITQELNCMQSSDFTPPANSPVLVQSSVTESRPLSASQSAAIVTQDAALLIIPLGFVAIWAAVVCVLSNTWKPGRKETERTNHTTQLPCKKCVYFSNNPYIKCAANPQIAMTKAAKNCGDFQPRDGKPLH